MRSPYEVRAQKELEASGHIVDWKMRPFRMMRRGTYSPDFFSLFDLCAIAPDKRSIRWISIKGKAGVPKIHFEEIKNFALPEGNIKEIWSRSLSKKQYWHKVRILPSSS